MKPSNSHIKLLTENRGRCRDCIFIKQDWTVVEDKKTGQLVRVLDWICDIADLFKNLDGYCDWWEPIDDERA